MCYYPYLEVLVIRCCDNLRVVTQSTFPSLQELFVEHINKEVLCSLLGNNFTSLTKVKVRKILKHEFLPVEIWQPGLKWLEVVGDREFQGFVRNKEECNLYLSRMISLRKVVICYSEEWKPLKDLKYLPNLEELDLQYLPNVEELELELLPFSYSVAKDSPTEADEEAEGFKHLISLRSLRISRWPKGNSLLHQLEHLTGLRKLDIWGCYGLVVLPNCLRNFSTLERLRVDNCPQLQKTYADREGEEYQKISHIKYILRGLNSVNILLCNPQSSHVFFAVFCPSHDLTNIFSVLHQFNILIILLQCPNLSQVFFSLFMVSHINCIQVPYLTMVAPEFKIFLYIIRILIFLQYCFPIHNSYEQTHTIQFHKIKKLLCT
ncbi:hypothetical protein MKW92_049033 [Papaver armeniacum]|nr:hypothetical protein MKW92_049033 [Papaver armeniacum]